MGVLNTFIDGLTSFMGFKEVGQRVNAQPAYARVGGRIQRAQQPSALRVPQYDRTTQSDMLRVRHQRR